jgi:hypothetical protein
VGEQSEHPDAYGGAGAGSTPLTKWWEIVKSRLLMTIDAIAVLGSLFVKLYFM